MIGALLFDLKMLCEHGLHFHLGKQTIKWQNFNINFELTLLQNDCLLSPIVMSYIKWMFSTIYITMCSKLSFLSNTLSLPIASHDRKCFTYIYGNRNSEKNIFTSRRISHHELPKEMWENLVPSSVCNKATTILLW